MLIYSKDRKSIVNANLIQVQRNLGGGKSEKYLISAVGESTGAVILSCYPEEKLAVDALEKIYNAFADGAASYKFD